MFRTRHLAALAAAAALATATLSAVTAPEAVATAPGYQPMSALIDGDSVTSFDGITDSAGNPISLEQFAAQKAGYSVTVVDGPTWQAMTASQFASYQLLVVGDPFCGYASPTAVDSASTWAPVVMGNAGGASTVGNRVVVGTDPEDHYADGGGNAQPTDPTDPTTAGAERLVQSGITYAGGVSGATGIYFDTSCEDPGPAGAASTDLPTVFNRLSVTGTGWTEDDVPPCGGSVQLVASVPAFAGLMDSDIQGWSCSDHITYPTYPTDWQPLAVATDTATTPTCGTDPSTGTTACGEAYVLIAGRGIVVTSPNLSLTPATDSAPAGGSQTVTADVSDGTGPVAGITVQFTVTGQNAGVSGTCAPASCASDSAGKVTFTYADVNGAGSDTINASAMINGSTQHASSSMTWTASTGPSVDAGPDVSGPVGTAIALNGSSANTTSTTWSVPAGTPCTFANPAARATSITCTSPGTYSATLTGTDGTTTVSDSTSVKVTQGSTGGDTCRGMTVTIHGTSGDDVILGTPGNDVISGGKGDDRIYGEGGNDVVCGEAGDDTVTGGRGADVVSGGTGADRVVGGTGVNQLLGGSGRDVCGAPNDGSDTYSGCESIS